MKTLEECFKEAGNKFPFIVEYNNPKNPEGIVGPIQIISRNEYKWINNEGIEVTTYSAWVESRIDKIDRFGDRIYWIGNESYYRLLEKDYLKLVHLSDEVQICSDTENESDKAIETIKSNLIRLEQLHNRLHIVLAELNKVIDGKEG